MIIQFHTPKGIIEVNSDTVTAAELNELGISRNTLNEQIPRDLNTEIDTLKVEIDKLKKGKVDK